MGKTAGELDHPRSLKGTCWCDRYLLPSWTALGLEIIHEGGRALNLNRGQPNGQLQVGQSLSHEISYLLLRPVQEHAVLHE